MLLCERETPEGLLVSVCDEECLGETYERGEMSLTVTEEFYGGDSAEEEEVVESLMRASVANLVGDRTVDVAIEAGIVDENRVLDLGGTRHAQLLWLR
jgi:hypothetical protein